MLTSGNSPTDNQMTTIQVKVTQSGPTNNGNTTNYTQVIDWFGFIGFEIVTLQEYNIQPIHHPLNFGWIAQSMNFFTLGLETKVKSVSTEG